MNRNIAHPAQKKIKKGLQPIGYNPLIFLVRAGATKKHPTLSKLKEELDSKKIILLTTRFYTRFMQMC